MLLAGGLTLQVQACGAAASAASVQELGTRISKAELRSGMEGLNESSSPSPAGRYFVTAALALHGA